MEYRGSRWFVLQTDDEGLWQTPLEMGSRDDAVLFFRDHVSQHMAGGIVVLSLTRAGAISVECAFDCCDDFTAPAGYPTFEGGEELVTLIREYGQ